METYSIRRMIFTPTDPRLGRHVNHDSRSLAYAYRGTRIGAVLHQRYVPIFDQGQTGSCTGNAGLGCLGTGSFYSSVRSVVDPSGVPDWDEVTARDYVYSGATKIDSYAGQYPPTDTGSDGLSVAKFLKSVELISGYQHALTFDDFLAGLSGDDKQPGRPAIVGTNWYNGMFTPDANGVVTIAAGDTVAGGHEYVARGYDPDKGLIAFDNSWGTSFAKAGTFYQSVAQFKRLLSEDGDATFFTAINVPAPIPVPPVPVDADAALIAAGNVWEKSILSKISKSGKMKEAFTGWKAAHNY